MPEPLLVIAGIPLALYQRIKAHKALKQMPGWNLKIIPSKHNTQAELHPVQIREILTLCLKSTDGAHVLAFSGQSKEERHGKIIELRRHFRFRWISNEYLAYLPSQVDNFFQEVQREANFELEWREDIRPSNVGSPLLLPHCAFLAKTPKDIWENAATIAPPQPITRKAQIKSLKSDIETFRDAHKHDNGLLDKAGLKFIEGYHGEPPDPIWYWKYTWRVPDYFHYDVSHIHGREFHVNGYDHTFAKQLFLIKEHDYINIDCHGRCRKGVRPLHFST